MVKQKNILYVILSVLSALVVVDILLFAFSVVSTIFFVAFLIGDILLIGLFIFLLVKIIKKIKAKARKVADVKSTGDYKTDIYEALGIPIQYNKDGSVKDIYELLEITPVFDENGNRMLTVYELLGIVPKFNQNGEEIPYVFTIKNGVKRIAKVDLTSRVLTRKLTEAEKEEQLIRETLKKKLAEAEKKGDKQKEVVIKKALVDKKPQAVSEYKPIKYTRGKEGKAIGGVVLGSGLKAKDIDTALRGKIFSAFSLSGADYAPKEKDKANDSVAKVEPVKYHDLTGLKPQQQANRTVPIVVDKDKKSASLKIATLGSQPTEPVPLDEGIGFGININTRSDGNGPTLEF